jgi:hypothetical protein
MVHRLRPLSSYFCRHQFVRRFEPERFWLECTSCGYETVGVQVARGGKQATSHHRAAVPFGAFVETVRTTS